MKNNYLAHYGVKGQRWGFRKKREVPYSDHIRQINKQYKNPFRDSILKRITLKNTIKIKQTLCIDKLKGLLISVILKTIGVLEER